MLGFNSTQKYYIYTSPTDMRKGYNGLSGIVRNEMRSDPGSGEVYIFFNRTRRLMKMLVWDHDGFVIYSKRLEKGTFEKIVGNVTQNRYSISYQHLVMLLSGIALYGVKQRPRYRMNKAS